MTRTRRQAQRYAMPGEGPTDEDLEHEIELTRRELSNTVAELVQRTNVKARVRLWARERRTSLITASGVALAVTALLVVLIRRR